MSRVTKQQTALVELRVMLNAISRDGEDYLSMGKFKARTELCDGTVVCVTITAPTDRSSVAEETKDQ